MAHRTVLRIPRVGQGQDEPDFVLVHVASAGQNQLDLKLIGTENEEVFSVSLKHSQTLKLQAKSNKLTQEEWDNLLFEILLGSVPDSAGRAVNNGVEAVAKVDAESLTITIQKRIEGITQKLGTISLPKSEDEIDIFQWCGKSIEAKDSSRRELETLKTTINDKDMRIKKLEEALTELTDLKRNNETQLLEKFSLLLNEKKLKIRDQQRLLAGATVDPARVEDVEESRLAVRSRPAGPSRKGKRKATGKAEPSDDESDGGFEKMEVDQPVVHDSDQERRNTSDEDTATQSEDENDDEPLPLPKRDSAEVTKKPLVSAKAPTPTDDEVPPKRILPFASKPPVQPQNPQEEGSETESDDEL